MTRTTAQQPGPSEPAPFRAAPERPPSYVAIDGTIVGDAVKFAHLVERRGHFVNLLDGLEPVAGDVGRLDPGPGHEHLPVQRLALAGKFPFTQDVGGGQKVTVMVDNVAPTDDRQKGSPIICPAGLNSRGKDGFWKAYGEAGAPDARAVWTEPYELVTYGRHTACERSARFMQEYLLTPAVEVQRTGDGGLGRTRVLSDLFDTPAADGRLSFAELVFVSSHGFMSGHLMGNAIESWPEAQPARVRPDDPEGTLPPTRGYTPMVNLFDLGVALKGKHGFNGPKWIIFAACSAVNPTLWPYWVRLFERSRPWVRGILAYELSAPDAHVANKITETFFDQLDAGRTILEAWREANATHKVNGEPQSWSAIVHEDARSDTFARWADLPALTREPTTGTTGRYVGFTGKEELKIRILPPELVLEVLQDQPPPDPPLLLTRLPAEDPDDVSVTAFLKGTPFGARFRFADDRPIARARIEVVNIRPNRPRVPWRRLFETPFVFDQEASATLSIDDLAAALVVETKPGETNRVLSFRLRMRPRIDHPNYDHEHAYFWFLVQLWAPAQAADAPTEYSFTMFAMS